MWPQQAHDSFIPLFCCFYHRSVTLSFTPKVFVQTFYSKHVLCSPLCCRLSQTADKGRLARSLLSSAGLTRCYRFDCLIYSCYKYHFINFQTLLSSLRTFRLHFYHFVFGNFYPRRRRGYCIWIRLFVCLFVCLSAQNFRVFLHNRLSDRDKIFTIAATTHVECFNHNYDVIGHVVWQPCWKNGKTLDLHL